jgi:tetratricopeptide (TPR) repeat protein
VTRTERAIWLLLVGRQPVRAVDERFRGMTHLRHLGEGLPVQEAFALLAAMDADHVLNLDAVSDHDRTRLHRLTNGSPRALELAYGVLAPGDCSFTWLLEFMAPVDSDGMVEHLLAHACERLSRPERRVLQALAVYGRPVPAAAVDHLVGDEIPDLDSRAVLGRLRRQRLTHGDGVRFSVPAIKERDYLIELLRREADAGPRTAETPEALMCRAADYFAAQRSKDPRQLKDLRAHLIEIELRLRAKDYRTAFERMTTVDDGYLHGWGASSALVPMLRTLVSDDGIPRDLRIDVASLLARALMRQEDHAAAEKELVRALDLASGMSLAPRRIVLREQLTEACLQLGNPRQAAKYSRRALTGAMRRFRDRDAMTVLAGLAMCWARAGRFSGALMLSAMARWRLKLPSNAKDRKYLPSMLFGVAWVYGQRGSRDRARSLLEESRRLATEQGDRSLAGSCLIAEAQLDLDDGDRGHAVDLAEMAAAIGVQNGDRSLCRVAMEVLAIARLDQRDAAGAARAADIAQRNRGSVLGFGLMGLAAYQLGEHEDARHAFHEGYTEATRRYHSDGRDFQFLDAYGLVSCGLALLDEPSYLTTAVRIYEEARSITAERGAVARTLLLLKQFEPHADASVLERVRAAATGEDNGRALQDIENT